MITRTELNPVILTPTILSRKRRLSVTTAMDSPKERATLSMIFIRLKKMSVQVKPGKKNTNINPRSALTTGSRSKKGKTNSNSSLRGDSQPTLYISCP